VRSSPLFNGSLPLPAKKIDEYEETIVHKPAKKTEKHAEEEVAVSPEDISIFRTMFIVFVVY
jgi:hypothetical protein